MSYRRIQGRLTARERVARETACMAEPDETFERLRRDADTTQSVPAKPDHGEGSASTIIEAPLKRRDPLDPHDFPDGGGSGGAEAYRRAERR